MAQNYQKIIRFYIVLNVLSLDGFGDSQELKML